MSFFKKAMNYLGLGPDEAYDDYEVQPHEPPRGRTSYGHDTVEGGTVRTIPPRSSPQREPVPQGRPNQLEYDQATIAVRSRQPSTVRTVAPATQAKPYTVRPRRFDQAQEVADRFKEGLPVIVNLQDVDRDLSRRLIDFASGLCYGLGGTMEKVAAGVYLLTPANVSLSPEDRRAIAEPADLD